MSTDEMTLAERLHEMAALCRSETSDALGALLDEAGEEITRLRDPDPVVRAVLAVLAKGGDHLAIFNAVRDVLNPRPPV